MWIPDSLYERLPLVYALGGIATLALSRGAGPAVLSGMALLVAAVWTYDMRRKHRTLAAKRPTRRSNARRSTK